MERLTERVFGRYRLKSTCRLDTLQGARSVVDRLAAYEDTGLEPEDVTDLMAAHGTAIGQLAEYRALAPLKHLRELVQVEKDGRLVAFGKDEKETSNPDDDLITLVKPSGDMAVKPCPFCGGRNIVYWKYMHKEGPRWRIACLSCLAMIDPGWVQERGCLADMWNKREDAQKGEGNG